MKTTKIKEEKVDELMQPAYSVEFHINGNVCLGSGETIEEALLAAKPDSFKTNSRVIVTDGVRSAEMLFNLARAKRLFVNPVFRQIIAKQLLLRLK